MGGSCLVFKSNLISRLSVEYCNNSAVNTIKPQFAEMASVLLMENLHEIQVMFESMGQFGISKITECKRYLTLYGVWVPDWNSPGQECRFSTNLKGCCFQ